MKVKEVQAIPITGGWYCDDKAALATGKAQSDHHLVRGEPQTPGFRAVREVGRGVGVVLHLDGGHVVCGDGTSVTYAGSAGRSPSFASKNTPVRSGRLSRRGSSAKTRGTSPNWPKA